MESNEVKGALAWNQLLWLVFAVALVLRVAAAIWLPAAIVWPDGERYVQVATNLLEGRGFGTLRDNALSVPTQPLLIAGVRGLFGDGFLVLRLVMAVLGAAACVVGCAVALRAFDARTALLTGVVLCFYPYLVYLSALFEYPQPLFILLVGLFFVLFYRWQQGGEGVISLAGAGLVLGLAVLTIPTALIFLGACGVLLVSRDLGATSRRLLVFFVAALLPIGAWVARNHDAYGRWVTFNAAGGYSLWQANNPTYLEHGKRGIVPPCAPGYEQTQFCLEYSALNERLGATEMPDVDRLLEFDRIANEKAWAFILGDPLVTLRLSIRKFLELWSPIPNAVTQGEAQGGRAATWVSVATYTPLLLLAIYGVVRSRRHWRRLLPIYLYVVTMAGPYCLFLPTTRYRLPIDFVLAMFAAYGVGSSTAWKAATARVPLLARLA